MLAPEGIACTESVVEIFWNVASKIKILRQLGNKLIVEEQAIGKKVFNG